MAFRLLEKTPQGKMLAAAASGVKSGRNRIGAVGELDISTVAKAPGEAFSISWGARNDDSVAGTVGLALLDSNGATISTTKGVILSPGEERVLTMTIPAMDASKFPASIDAEIFTIAMIPLAWEDAPPPQSEEFTNLAYGSSIHTFTLDYTEAKQRGTSKEAKRLEALAEEKREEKRFDAYLQALRDNNVTGTEVPYNHGDWHGLMDAFLDARKSLKKVIDPNIKLTNDWLADLQKNGLSEGDLSLADWQAGKLSTVLSNRQAASDLKTDKQAFFTTWGDFRQRMGESGFAPSMPAYQANWNSTFQATERDYQGRIDKRISDKAAKDARERKLKLDKADFQNESFTAGFGGSISYSSNWRNVLSDAKSKRQSDRLRAEATQRREAIAAQAKIIADRGRARLVALEAEREAQRKALAWEAQQQEDYYYQETPMPGLVVTASNNRISPTVTPPPARTYTPPPAPTFTEVFGREAHYTGPSYQAGSGSTKVDTGASEAAYWSGYDEG